MHPSFLVVVMKSVADSGFVDIHCKNFYRTIDLVKAIVVKEFILFEVLRFAFCYFQLF